MAERLLAVRGPRPLGNELAALPLLRAQRLPDDKDEAWSVSNLQQAASQLRVFFRPNPGEEAGSIEFPPDSKQAAMELADAIGESVWLVDAAVASMAEIPVALPEALASAVLCSTTIESDTSRRIALLT